jgi:serpin B
MTNPGSFWLADGTEVEATLMRRFDETWWMAEEEGVVSVVRLPYVDDEISMYVVLPETADGLPGIEAGLSPERIQGWIDQIDAEEHHVDGLVLPRFTVSTNLELSGVLASMGMPGAFDASTADFSGVAGDEEPSLHLSKVFHQAWLSVDESGTEAGGATVVISTNGDPVVVKVQHPFLFFVRDDLTHTVLFAGRCADPR